MFILIIFPIVIITLFPRGLMSQLRTLFFIFGSIKKQSKAALVKQDQFPSPSLSFSLWVLGSLTMTSPLFGHQGRVECWDPRVRNRVGTLDCALSSLTEGTEYVTPLPLCTQETAVTSCRWHSILSLTVCTHRVQGLPSISALKFNGSLTMAVGTSTGQVKQN